MNKVRENNIKLISVRVDATVKEEAEDTLKDLGLNMSDAINIFLRQVVLTSSIPFAIKRPKYNRETMEAIEEAKAISKNPTNYKSYNNFKELMEDIDN